MIDIEKFKEFNATKEGCDKFESVVTDTINLLVIEYNNGEKVVKELLGHSLLKQLKDDYNKEKLRAFLIGNHTITVLDDIYYHRKFSVNNKEEVLTLTDVPIEVIRGLENIGINVIGVAEGEMLKNYYTDLDEIITHLYKHFIVNFSNIQDYSLNVINNLTENVDTLNMLNELSQCENCGMYYRYYQMIITTTIHDKTQCPHCHASKGKYTRNLESVTDNNVYEYLKDFVDCMELNSVTELKEMLLNISEYKEKAKFKMLMAESINSELTTMNNLTNYDDTFNSLQKSKIAQQTVIQDLEKLTELNKEEK